MSGNSRNFAVRALLVIATASIFMAGIAFSSSHAASGLGGRIYDTIPSPYPGGFPSIGFQARSTDEFGDHIAFAGTERGLGSVIVSMTNWACGNDFTWNGTTWVEKVGSAPCTTDTSTGAGYEHPITLNIYEVDIVGGKPAAGDLIVSKTDDFFIEFRPSATPELCNGDTFRWYDPADGICYNGYAFNIEFDFSADNVTLPNEVIFGIAYNTQTHGANPTNVNGPYNSLNVSVVSAPPTIGTNVEPVAFFQDSSWSGAYCSTPPVLDQFIRDGDCWIYTPAVQFNLQPADVSLTLADPMVCNTSEVTISFSDVSEMYGYEFVVEYDKTKVSADGSFVNTWFDTTDPEEAYVLWPGTCEDGECKFAATLTSPATPLNGDGAVAKIALTSIAGGTFPLKIKNVVLTNMDAFEIPVEITDDTINVGVCGTAAISGKVNLQGRLTPMDAGSVKLVDTEANFPDITVPFDANGNFTVPNVPVLPTGSTYSIRALHGLYLDNLKTLSPLLPGASLTGQNTRLLGGDADNSGMVDIGDLSCMGGFFGEVSPNYGICGTTGSPDINLDLRVNIQDLSLAGGNYNKTSPQGW